ncbi:hypothetical protein TKK_0001002 [Trichogramma kaykai]|uniref:Protein transport protein Sec24C n=1 Tax=Trichogramma kaykai TaxID=54128 RepID=A0ABD2WRL2_9HYME
MYTNPIPVQKQYPAAPAMPGQLNNSPYGVNQNNKQTTYGPGQPILNGNHPNYNAAPSGQLGQSNSTGLPNLPSRPNQGPPMSGPLMQGQHPPASIMQGPPRSGPPMQDPPMQGLPMQGPPMQSPPMQGPPMQGPPMQGPHMQGPPMQGPPIHLNQLTQGSSLMGSSAHRQPLLSQPGQGLPPAGQLGQGPPPMSQIGQNAPQLMPALPGKVSYQPTNMHANHNLGQNSYPPGQSLSTQMGQMQINSSPYGMNQNMQQPQYGYGPTPMYGNQPNMYHGGMTNNLQNQQAGKIQNDHMPNPIAVYEEDKKNRSGIFATNQKNVLPPMVTTKFVVQDQGNASPRFIKSTLYSIPTTQDLMKQAGVPFGIVLNPMALVEKDEYEPPIVDMGELGPVRCVRCKAYMCPYMQFVDAGRRFQCMFCKATTDVPTEYFQHLDHTGQRMDRHERPELVLGTFEYVALKEYCRNNVLPKPPALIFVIDVSYNNVKSGFVNLLCSQMKNILCNLPVDVGQTKSNMKVGFITYNNSIHFYNCKANLAQPQMLFVGDIEDIFMPLLEGFLCDIEESESTIDALMAQIPIMFGETRETETVLGPAIQAGLEALKASECAGKLLVFHSSLPTREAPGRLKNRDERNLIGTDKEKTVLVPQTNYYTTLGQDCVAAGCSVDLFLLNNSYIDVATIGQVSRVTGGEVYKYTYFQSDIDGERLITDIVNNINRPTAFDAVMRVRTSTGVRPTDFHGHLHMQNTTDIELGSIDSDKTISIEIKHDDKLAEEESVYIQAALLYTSCGGIRRLRIINLNLPTTNSLVEIYRLTDLDAMLNFLLKQSVMKMVDHSPKAIKDGLMARAANILAVYRKSCAQMTNPGQLILPETMKLLPIYLSGIFKSDAFSAGSAVTIDQKSHVMMLVTSMPISESLAFMYPRVLPVHNVDPLSEDLPPVMRCSIEKFEDDGAYIIENGISMFLWLGLSLNSQWTQGVFNVSSVIQIDTDKNVIPVLDNPLNTRVRNIIGDIQSERRYCMKMILMRQHDKMEMMMKQLMVEDRGPDGSPGYVDFLCTMHREVQNLIGN